MSNRAVDLPAKFFTPQSKYEVISWLAQSGLPARIASNVLGEWAKLMGVELTATDYDLVRTHRVISTIPNIPQE